MAGQSFAEKQREYVDKEEEVRKKRHTHTGEPTSTYYNLSRPVPLASG